MPVIPAEIFCKLSALGETFCRCTTWKSKNTLRLDINTFTLLHHFLCNPPAIEVNSTHMHTCISVQRSLRSQGCVTPGSITYVSTKSMQIDHSNDIECTIDCLRKKNERTYVSVASCIHVLVQCCSVAASPLPFNPFCSTVNPAVSPAKWPGMLRRSIFISARGNPNSNHMLQTRRQLRMPRIVDLHEQ